MTTTETGSPQASAEDVWEALHDVVDPAHRHARELGLVRLAEGVQLAERRGRHDQDPHAGLVQVKQRREGVGVQLAAPGAVKDQRPSDVHPTNERVVVRDRDVEAPRDVARRRRQARLLRHLW